MACSSTSISAGVFSSFGVMGMSTFLVGKPVVTFWRSRYRQHSQFQTETVSHQLQNVRFGAQNARACVGKSADLLYFAYVVYELPGIRACDPGTVGGCGTSTNSFPVAKDCDLACSEADEALFKTYATTGDDDPSQIQSGIDNYLLKTYRSCNQFGRNTCSSEGSEDTCVWAHWANAIGQLLTKNAAVIIGNQVVDVLNSDMLFIWEELAGQPGKRLTEMIGKRYSREDLIYDSQQTRFLYCPLPFFFTQAPGKALAIVSALYTGVEISLCFEDLINCIVVSHDGLVVLNCHTGQPIQAGDLVAWIDLCHVYLDVPERDKFAVSSFNTLIKQHQYQSFMGNFNQMLLTFSHPVIELIIVFRRECQEASNNWFNYTGLLGKDPLWNLQLQFNSSVRQQRREATYYRLVQPWQFHTNIPDVPIYVYSFALYPEDVSSTGTVNFSRFESVTLSATLQPGLTTAGPVTCFVHATSFNLLKHVEGLLGAMFTL